MRLPFLVLLAIAPLDACSETLVPAPAIVIRGAQAPDAALIIVDGVVVRRSAINPADVEQVEIIKGPAAAALYGAETRCPAIVVHTRPQSSVQMVRDAKRQ